MRSDGNDALAGVKLLSTLFVHVHTVFQLRLMGSEMIVLLIVGARDGRLLFGTDYIFNLLIRRRVKFIVRACTIYYRIIVDYKLDNYLIN